MGSDNYFEPIEQKVYFPSLEKTVLASWKKNNIEAKYRAKNKSAKKIFSFLDGPITANNPMAVHHAWGRTYKDLWQRFKNMQGFKQRFQNGFDCQGLWVEVEVEKELGLKNKKDIENLVEGDKQSLAGQEASKKASVAKFVELCKARAKKFAAIQTEQTIRLGNFMDWDNSYYTLSDENNYMIWRFLKKCHEDGLIYKGHDVVPWCPRCETAISQHEMLTEDYKELTHDTIYIAYPVDGKPNTYLLAWTTTPWTLPGNIAVAVDPALDYVEAEVEGKTYIMVRQAAERLKLKVNKIFKGKELVGLTYGSPFDELPRMKKTMGDYQHRVIASDKLILPVTTEEGTGMVHIAPGQGAEDYQLGKNEKLPVIELVDDEAVYLNELGEFSGQNAKKHPEIIIEFLKSKDSLFKTEKYTHRYPACWRCRTELIWKLTDEWYIAMDKPFKSKTLRQEMMEVTKKIKWLPEFGLERELDWLANMHDWLISKKNRYWGLALPIWECPKCISFEVIGSKKELKDKAVLGWKEFESHSPHKPFIDEVKIKCPKCGGEVGRIDDVGNPWLDAGIVSFSTISNDNKSEPLYLTDKKEFDLWFPADFITESFPGQFKNWFYSLIAMSTVLEETNPFKSVLGFATCLAEDGKPMHKSSGNSIEFNEAADKIGVDVMRWMFVRQNPAENLLFGYHLADEVRRRFHLMLWNVYNFFVTYANLDGWKPEANLKLKIYNLKLSVLDKWILARLGETTGKVTKDLEAFDAASASGEIDLFVNDLSLWYIRRSRDRVGPAADSEDDKKAFYQTTHHVLTTLSKLIAPFMPFLSETIYQNLTKGESVHLEDWPDFAKASSRETHDNLQLIKEMGMVREIVEKVHGLRKEKIIPVRQPLNKLSIYNLQFTITDKDLTQLLLDEVNIKAAEFVSGKGEIKIEIDTKITPELEEEAKTRELIRVVQDERKKMGLNLTDKIKITNPWVPKAGVNLERLEKKTVAKETCVGQFKIEKV